MKTTTKKKTFLDTTRLHICKAPSRTLIPEFSIPNFEWEWMWQSVH